MQDREKVKIVGITVKENKDTTYSFFVEVYLFICHNKVF